MNWKKKISACVAIIGGVTLVIHIANRIITFFSTLDNKLSKENGNMYHWRFGDIYYTKHGAGSPILLIHSLTNYSSGYEWSGIINKLSETNTVYCVDLLGCGRSEKPLITYTNFLYVQLISDFIKDEIGEKTDIITSTNSIAIVTMSALYNKDIIGKIAVSNPPDLNLLSLSPTKRSLFLRLLINLPVLGTFIYNITNTKHVFNNIIATNTFANSIQYKETVNVYHESAHIGGISSKHLFASVKGKYANINIIPALENINNSIYVIVSNSTPNYLTVAEQYKKHNPSLEIISITNTGTYPQLENPVEFIEHIKILFDL